MIVAVVVTRRVAVIVLVVEMVKGAVRERLGVNVGVPASERVGVVGVIDCASVGVARVLVMIATHNSMIATTARFFTSPL